MARVTLGTGDTITVGGVTEIFGTSGAQSVNILDGSTITFRSGFNSGGDTIRLNGKASDFVASISGSNVTLFSATDGITVVIPIGTVANTLVFDNGDTRSLSIVGGVPTLGGQALNGTPVALTAGPGTYTVTAGDTGTEGDTITFTVTRTDATSAEVLQFNVQGDTAGGIINAATAGADFTSANTPIVFAAGQTTATFTVDLNTDNNVEGIEGYLVQVLSGSTVVASTAELILDANNVGQTFDLTTGIDRVGTGSALDLVGSEGSTNTNGQDIIVAQQGDINTFDNINGGADQDLLIVLDNAAPLTFAPNFANVTINNIEALQYNSQRGLFNGAINTVPWTGLANAEFNIDGFGEQTFTFDIDTSAVINQAGNGDLDIRGGGGTLLVRHAGGDASDSDIEVGTNGGANAWNSVTIEGGDDVDIQDNGAQDLTTVVLDGIEGDADLSGAAIANVSVSNLVDGEFDRDLDISANNVTVTLSDIDVGDLDVTSSSVLTVIGNSTVDGLDQIAAGNNVTVRSTGGTLSFNDVTSNGAGRTVTLDAAGGSLLFDDILGADVRNVVITGSGRVDLDAVTQSGNVAGTVITSTNAGGVSIATQLGNNTQFNGSGNTGGDDVTFGMNTRANTFGGGNDNVRLTTASLGTGGSLDGGAGSDRLFMESNDAMAFTAGGATATSNFEELELTGQDIGKADVINLNNIGFTDLTNVTSNVGNTAPQTEVVTISFAGLASGPSGLGNADSVTFDGVTVSFTDGDGPAALAAAFIAQYGVGPNWTATAGANPGEVVLTANNPGFVTDLTSADFVFTDATSIGSVGFEQSAFGPPVTVDNGNAPFAGINEVRTLNLDFATVLTGQTITITQDVFGPDPVFTFTAPADLSHVGGELATFFAAAWNAAGGFTDDWVASVSGNNVVFTAVNPGDFATIFNTGNFTVGGTGLGAGDTFSIDNATVAGADPIAGDDEDVEFILDGIATGNDQIIFDGVTITFQDGDGPTALANAFEAQYNAVPFANRNWTVTGTPGGLVVLESNADINVTPNLSAADFQFIDDDNVGTPSVGVAVTNQGSTSSVTLNSFVSGSTLTLNAALGTHTVNVRNNSASDVINVVLDQDGDHGSLTANAFETVNIDVRNDDATANPDVTDNDALVLNNTSLTTLVVTGQDGLDLETNSTSIRSIDATGLTAGAFEWEADANTVNIIVKTGAGGSVVDFSAITLSGGNTFTNEEGNQTAPVLFIGAGGNDTIITGDVGSARGTITTGGGNDVVFVGIVDGGNDFWSITDFDAFGGPGDLVFDRLDFGASATFAGLDQELEPTATFQDYLDQAARGAGPGFVAGTVRYFYWNGDTYVVQDNTDGEDFVDGSDTVIRIEGEVVLTSENIIP